MTAICFRDDQLILFTLSLTEFIVVFLSLKVFTLALQWTDKALDFVEIIYGINEMGCINGGEITLKRLAPDILFLFRCGVERLLPLLH